MKEKYRLIDSLTKCDILGQWDFNQNPANINDHKTCDHVWWKCRPCLVEMPTMFGGNANMDIDGKLKFQIEYLALKEDALIALDRYRQKKITY